MESSEQAAHPSHDGTSQPRKKKRRTLKACEACRKSKRLCDHRRPCSQCVKLQIDCVVHDGPQDPTVERLERIEEAIDGINQRLSSSDFQSPMRDQLHTSPHDIQGGRIVPSPATTWSADSAGVNLLRSQPHSFSSASAGSFAIRQPVSKDVVVSGLVSDHDARSWFANFFEGSDRFVTVFDPRIDTYTSVRSRNSVLFDIIVLFGCRAAHGALSSTFQQLYSLLRKHTSDLVLLLSSPGDRSAMGVEHIQALLVIASYSDSGSILCDIALRAAIDLGLVRRADDLFASLAGVQYRDGPSNDLYPSVRVWYGAILLDQILSLDGGKPGSVLLRSSPRRVRALLSHPRKTALDVRLFAQVELNALRLSASDAIAAIASLPLTSDLEGTITRTITGAILDLDLWLSEWQDIISRDIRSTPEHPIMHLNLRVQHTWAILALHLRGLAASGIANIALMTDSQRSIAYAAKAAAERHLQLLLTSTNLPSTTTTASSSSSSPTTVVRPYISSLRYAMEFVWAKNAFCILMVLRLGILLADPLPQLMQRLHQVREFLSELDKAGMGANNTSYTRILAQTVEKCEQAMTRTQQGGGDFQDFIPKEFTLEWDFPGLGLYYIPLDWQDLLLDLGGTVCTDDSVRKYVYRHP